jgi:Probable Zinc-ribbon domain
LSAFKGPLSGRFPELYAQLLYPEKDDCTRVMIPVWWQCPVHLTHRWEATISARTNAKSGCPFCTGNRITLFNCLWATHPHIALMLDNVNDGFTVGYGSNRLLKWRCDKGHVTETIVKCKVKYSVLETKGCGGCSNKKTILENCLATTHPELAAYLVYPSDGLLVTAGSKKKVMWFCEYDKDHHWLAKPNSRTSNNTGCPVCTKGSFKKQEPAYLYVLRAPTHIVYGITGVNAKSNRLATYPKDRILLHKFIGDGDFVREVEFEIGKRFVQYRGSRFKGEKVESLFLSQEDELISFLKKHLKEVV